MNWFDTIKQKIFNTISKFSLTEKTVFFFFLIILVGSIFSILVKINYTFMTEVPQRGGEIKEGLIGIPRFINPVIAISDTDKDITSLVYSGILKINSKGEIENDLAEDFTISEDGLVYYAKIRDDAFFHDGTPVTVEDIIFTIQKTQDPKIKSPKRPNWDGVTVQKINEKEIEFILSQPYSPFIYNLTMGILPKHIWENISSEEFAFSKYNLEPIGSGPYVVKKIKTDGDGVIKRYYMESYKRYTLGQPYISDIKFYFYRNENDLLSALKKGSIDSAHSISPEKIEEMKMRNKNILVSPFSRVFALYFNQSENEAISDKTVRKILNDATPKNEIINEILKGYAKKIEGPVPAKQENQESIPENISVEEAKLRLEENGWSLNEDGIYEKETDSSITRLEFSISTANVEELVEVSEKLANVYRQIGADVSVKIFEPNDLTLNVIRPRDFESIFFGQVVNRDLDFYAFWHSSQRNDPGLNIAGFTNIEADKHLEKIRATFDNEEKEESLQNFEKEVINDLPAIFLYSPDFVYLIPNKLKMEIPENIVTSSDRFLDIEKWYIKTDFVWNIFIK